MGRILRLGAKIGKLPERIIHNDTKFNNVLLDEQDKAQCVIDLDTVMPGYVAYDFGDAVRSIINDAPEDEPELSLIQLNMPLVCGLCERLPAAGQRFFDQCRGEFADRRGFVIAVHAGCKIYDRLP